VQADGVKFRNGVGPDALREIAAEAPTIVRYRRNTNWLFLQCLISRYRSSLLTATPVSQLSFTFWGTSPLRL